jgi:8-oxo-dGTP pyrophosphatase MutT (NUDIX family)
MKIYRISAKREIVAAVMVVNHGKVLILKRGSTAPWMPNKWNLPGGIVEGKEDLRSAALRECKEETGLNVSNLAFVNKYINPEFDLYIFRAETKDTNVNMDFESSDWAWVDKNNYAGYDYVPYVKEAISGVLSENI